VLKVILERSRVRGKRFELEDTIENPARGNRMAKRRKAGRPKKRRKRR